MNNELMGLNKALKGEHMAIESFDHYIQDMNDPELKKKLMDMQQQHKFHAIQLSERIQQLGGNPVNTSGIVGAAAEVWFKLTPKKYMNGNIIESAYHGEKMGLNSYMDIMHTLCDQTNKDLIKEMMNDNVKIIEDLNSHMQ